MSGGPEPNAVAASQKVGDQMDKVTGTERYGLAGMKGEGKEGERAHALPQGCGLYACHLSIRMAESPNEINDLRVRAKGERPARDRPDDFIEKAQREIQALAAVERDEAAGEKARHGLAGRHGQEFVPLPMAQKEDP